MHLPPPVHGTDRPLDRTRLAAILQHQLSPAALFPGSNLLPPDVQLDIMRLGWIWGFVGDVSASDSAEWLRDASTRIRETADRYRNWPIPFASGPAAEAALLDAIPREELEAIEERRVEIAAAFAALYSKPESADYHSIRDEDRDALPWLNRTDAECDLAGNRFDDREEASIFVRSLYDAGAKRVVIASESIRREGKRSWYADAIRVELPTGQSERKELFSILNSEARDEGFDEEPDTGQSTLYMWWD